MKKFVAILIAAIMLVSLVPSTFAAPATDYYVDMNGRFRIVYPGTDLLDDEDVYTQFTSSHNPENPAGASNFIVAGDNTLRKSADDKIWMAQLLATGGNNNWVHSNFNAVPLTYAADEKLYLRGQFYVPSVDPDGESYAGYNDSFKMHMFSLTMDGISVGNVISLVGNNTTSNGFYVRGDTGLVPTQTWNFDEWFTIEAIITFGTNATMSIYYNGQPLTFTSGALANTENIALGSTTKVTAVTPFYLTSNNGIANARKRVIYTDNWGIESYEADEDVKRWTPPAYCPIAFGEFTDGSKVIFDYLTQVTVSVGREECTEVSLFINDESVGTMTEAPYVFPIPADVELGNATFKAIAKTDTETFERSVNVLLAQLYPRKAMDQNMDAYNTFGNVADGGWYSPSSRFSLSGLVPNGWFMNPEVVQDKAKKSFGKAVKLGCAPESGEKYIAQSDYSYDYIDFGYTGLNATGGSISGYTADLNFQMYMDNGMLNTNMTDAFTLTTGQELFRWDHTEQKLKWNVKGDPVYTPVKYQYWQNYMVKLDMSSATTKMSLTIDGEKIFEDRELASTISNFNIIKWHYAPNPVTGNFVAIDEVLLMHYTPRPGFGEAIFYRGETENIDLKNISPLTDTITINMGKDLMPNLLSEYVKVYENGEELTFTDDDGEVHDTEILLYNGLLYLVPPCPLLSDTEYSISLDKDALFADSVKIGYDQTFTFKTAKADLDVMEVTYYKNGTPIENLDTATFAAGDKIKAEITVCNANILDEYLYVMLLGYNGKLLTASDITYVTAVAEKADNVFETAEITVGDATDFSVSAAVWNGDFLPIANATVASGNQ